MLRTKEIDNVSLTKNLQVHGWSHLDAVLLAALTTEYPLLLVGPHGTAKTYLAERMALALGLNFRHYNSSLINYDDLVGIPMPDEQNQSLNFISSKGSIWQAEFVFFDEISRCRPDLQNKLFPIIHEKRVIGMDLTDLRFRWAAMNPPSPDAADMNVGNGEIYLGSEPLDPALTDRFPFIIPVPTWDQLTRADRRQLLSAGQAISSEQPIEQDLVRLVNRCAELIPEIETEHHETLTEYLISLLDLLEKAKIPQSPRRARMLLHTMIAVHAARIILEGECASIDESAELALSYGLPQSASEVPPSPAAVLAAHNQAWDIASCLDDENWRIIMEESDYIKRVVIAEELGFEGEDFSRLITQALNVDQSEAQKIALATAMFLAFREKQHLTPAAWEPLSELAIRVLQPRMASMNLAPSDTNTWNQIKDFSVNQRNNPIGLSKLEANYVLSGFPHLWRKYDWQESLAKFREYISLFGISAEAQGA